MKKAGFRYVFLGIENILEDDLTFLKARAKNSLRETDGASATRRPQAVDVLHRHGMLVVGGLIVGNPDDTREAIAANLAFARTHVDWPYIQHPTPYPGTPMTRDFVERGLIVNSRVEEYDGTTAVTRSAHLSAEEIEFMRWRAERWMKVRHMATAIRHDPGFVLRNGRRMLAHTFRGTTWRSVLGLEDARAVFRRYRAIRSREREYIDWPDPMPRRALDEGDGGGGDGGNGSQEARERDICRIATGPWSQTVTRLSHIRIPVLGLLTFVHAGRPVEVITVVLRNRGTPILGQACSSPPHAVSIDWSQDLSMGETVTYDAR